MPDAPVVVYLDSSDYSTLSDPRRRTRTVEEIRAALLRLARSPSVVFAFSGAHLSGMAPLEAKYAPAATARADMLVELCGRNALISFDRLIRAETDRLANPQILSTQALSSDAEWFPELEDTVSPIKWADTAREIDTAIKEKGLNRKQRRTFKRQLFKSNQPQPVMREWLATQASDGDLTDALRMYPMRPQDAKMLSQYVLGHATAAQAESAFLESLRDPRWMMRWFAAHHDKLTPVTEWLRGPSKALTGHMTKIATDARELRRLEAASQGGYKAELLTSTGWGAAQDQLLLNIGNRLLHQAHPETRPAETVEVIDATCPGLSTAVRALHSAAWDSMGEQPRSPRESDVVDVVHSLYAPYVSVFRADRYMAPHIQRQVASRGVRVVSRLEDLPDLIESMLQ